MTLNENLVALTEHVADAIHDDRCAIADLQDQLDAEAQARAECCTTLTTALDNERAARIAGDAELDGKLDAERQARIDGDERLGDELDAERDARIAGDVSLGQRIDLLRDGLDAEQQARIDADDLLSDRITAEVAARISGDAALGDRITLESIARENGDIALGNRVDSLRDDLLDEVAARAAGDSALQDQIDAMAAASDVVDVVGTKADLDDYDTSYITDKDIIKVLADEAHGGAITYYRWDAGTESWEFIGSQGPVYTKAEADGRFVRRAADNIGSATQPIYVSGGQAVASNANVGSANLPVYMSGGNVTQCGNTLNVSVSGSAVSDGQGRNIVDTYATKAEAAGPNYGNLIGSGVSGGISWKRYDSGIVTFSGTNNLVAASEWITGSDDWKIYGPIFNLNITWPFTVTGFTSFTFHAYRVKLNYEASYQDMSDTRRMFNIDTLFAGGTISAYTCSARQAPFVTIPTTTTLQYHDGAAGYEPSGHDVKTAPFVYASDHPRSGSVPVFLQNGSDYNPVAVQTFTGASIYSTGVSWKLVVPGHAGHELVLTSVNSAFVSWSAVCYI